MADLEYACAVCGHEQDSMDKPCEKCASPRVLLISVIVAAFGVDWRKAFAPAEVSRG